MTRGISIPLPTMILFSSAVYLAITAAGAGLRLPIESALPPVETENSPDVRQKGGGPTLDPPMGACCYGDDRICADMVETECETLNGAWFLGLTCNTFDCEIPPCPRAVILVVIHTDDRPEETTWRIEEQDYGEIVGSGGPYTQPDHLYHEFRCVPDTGCYRFTIQDSGGDGLCCDQGEGYYVIYYGSQTVCSGGEFEYEESCGWIGCDPPSGACCWNGHCMAFDEQMCNFFDGQWRPYADCDEIDCAGGCDADFCVTAPYASEMINTCGAGDDCDLGPAPDLGWRVEIPDAGWWKFMSTPATRLYVGSTHCGLEIGESDAAMGEYPRIVAHLEPGYFYVTFEHQEECGRGSWWVSPTNPCAVECPPDGTPEGEPICHEGYVDEYNGGCYSSVHAFQLLSCGQTICGTTGGYLFNGDDEFDTDWYEFETSTPTTLHIRACAEFASIIQIYDADQSTCDLLHSVAYGGSYADRNELHDCAVPVGAGRYWIVLAPDLIEATPCGVQYTLSLDCLCGDFDRDADVDADDFGLFLIAYGTCAGDVEYREAYDFDADGCLTLIDYQRWMECYRE